MNGTLTIESTIHFSRRAHSRKQIVAGPAPMPAQVGRVPRIAKLTALAIRFEGLVRSGAVSDYAELARLGHVTRARITQIMNLLLLAPDIQERLLFLARIERGKDPYHLRDLLPIAAEVDWQEQRKLWRELAAAAHADVDACF